MHLRFLLACLVVPAASATAQVGFLPSQSPYRELTHGSYLELNGGRMLGTGGLLRLGPRNGSSMGARYVLRGNHTLQVSFGLWTAGTKRSLIDADDSVATRDKGLIGQRLYGAEFGLQFNVTGGKTWHGLAPFAGIGLGLVRGQSSPVADTSGYKFGTKLFFAPTLGTRFFVGQRVYLKVDMRAVFWKLAYPLSYSDEPARQPGTIDQSNAVNLTGLSGQYTLTPEIRFGIGIHW